MGDLLREYYVSLGELLLILGLAGAAGLAALWVLRSRWRGRMRDLERTHADDLAGKGREYLHDLHQHLQSALAHEFVKGLDYIAKKGVETLEGLGEEEQVLRDKQRRIVTKAHDLMQHADNILDVFAPRPAAPRRELLSMRRLVEHLLLELYPYAQSRGVTLRPSLEDVEPTALDRSLTLQTLRNLVHNAIKYSHPGGAVAVELSLERSGRGAERRVAVEVRDRGRGIPEEERERIFELRERGDGLIEPGSGLGLYAAREAARRQGGDVVLVRSGPNQGSVFKATFPYDQA